MYWWRHYFALPFLQNDYYYVYIRLCVSCNIVIELLFIHEFWGAWGWLKLFFDLFVLSKICFLDYTVYLGKSKRIFRKLVWLCSEQKMKVNICLKWGRFKKIPIINMYIVVWFRMTFFSSKLSGSDVLSIILLTNILENIYWTSHV